MRIGFLWHIIKTSSSLYTVTPSLVNIDTLPLSAALINDVGNFSNVSDSSALLESYGKGSLVTYLLFHAPPFATPTSLAEMRNIGSPNLFLSFLLRWWTSAPGCYVNIVVSSLSYNVAIAGLRLNCICLLSRVIL